MSHFAYDNASEASINTYDVAHVHSSHLPFHSNIYEKLFTISNPTETHF